ncbi:MULTISPECIES: peptidoglycan-binding domain-containing protein [unclassified Tolypothrix]|uniref:peptidoglycan-binding domain-containing protein n=1 Tax=unclassified Tolypothrix TaxID=2649714 RepID=UPI0005EAA20F|nr:MULTISPECIES: peptidoglycan-binding protein [unclassified Tolypothrix]BAY88154.1 peptidoglycan-binding domain 1 protein [Microchaete diplosiphon NIES-3275]EKF02006.1 putative peptidoglycan-binding protein [Tolypothrix sp. PCC 7601]MBE9087610.1 peptidoglycan-binding protein [Tolypothrix sp. LEGE 11397]UYD28858.1 peptidoglycan-binding protein [Tolypothrix sp. PCC 7712]UYD35231.1 peptidoglycan-binding protein [Tolypothrix sp. PCC 7601]
MAFNVNVLKLPVIKVGSNSAVVTAWQSFLKDAEFPIGVVDGDFGKQTDQATRSYQQRNGLTADGVVGNMTYAKALNQGLIFKLNLPANTLLSYLNFGEAEVKDLQASLNKTGQLNPLLKADGDFGITSNKGLAEAYKKRDVRWRSELEAALSDATKQKLGQDLTPALDILNGYAKIQRFCLSGAHWIDSFPTSRLIADLASPFRQRVEAFQKALIDAGCQVIVTATHRPKERAYLMHYAARINRQEIAAKFVPQMAGVNIEWEHYTNAGSVQAAKEMVEAYGVGGNPVSLNSRHIQRLAIDWNVTWNGKINIKDANGKTVTISDPANAALNRNLWTVGSSYGVYKLSNDPPHWSVDGY